MIFILQLLAIPEMNAGELLEVMATAGGCGDFWKPWRVAGDARNMMENYLSILIVILPHNSNTPRPQTESYIFSNLALEQEQNFRNSLII